ncbi:MAG: hypothetical protein ACRDBQ_18875 [Shewanella sp.]
MLKLIVLSRKRNVLEVAVAENKNRCGLFHYRHLSVGEEITIPLSRFEQEVDGGVFGLSASGLKKIRAKATIGISATRKYGKRTYEVHLVKGNVKDILSPSLMEFKPVATPEKTCPLESISKLRAAFDTLGQSLYVSKGINRSSFETARKCLDQLENDIKVMEAANRVMLENQDTLNARIDKLTDMLAGIKK